MSGAAREAARARAEQILEEDNAEDLRTGLTAVEPTDAALAQDVGVPDAVTSTRPGGVHREPLATGVLTAA
ncbi:MAG: hypothetical protein JJE50_06000 [Actinomycetales bacterium]|nr:hypothetical protein [Actinomycetales bacterium]